MPAVPTYAKSTRDVFLDIETFPDAPDDIWDYALSKVPSNVVKKNEWAQKHGNEVVQKRALDPITGLVISAAMAVGDGDVQQMGPYTNDDPWHNEDLVLQGVQALLLDVIKPYRWIGHNIDGFDLVFLRGRAFRRDLPLLVEELHFPDKPWERTNKVVDTMLICKQLTTRRGGWVSLDEMCRFTGTGGKDGNGAMVLEMYARGQLEQIAEYNTEDVEMTRRLFRRLQKYGLVT